MKKLFLAAWAVLLPFTPLAAQTLNLELKKAVDGLGARFNRAIEVRILPVTLAETDTPTAFSEYLLTKISQFAANTSCFNVASPDRYRSLAAPQNTDRASISGVYTRLGSSVDVTLYLIAEADNLIMSSVSFTVPLAELEAIGLSLLPPDAKTEAEVREKEEALASIPSDRPQASAEPQTTQTAPQSLVLSAWADSESGIFYDGDTLAFSIFADKDCYVMVYHIDSARKMQLIFPNTMDKDNFVQGGAAEIRIPQNASYNFALHAPFGQDTVIVKAAFKQFPNIEAEMKAPLVEVTPETVENSVSRGISIQPAGSENTQAKPDAVTRFTYTVLPASENRQTAHYSRPADMDGFLRDLSGTVIAQDGRFNGGETGGSFSGPGFSGTYRIEGGDIVFTWTEQINAERAARARSVAPKKGYRFSFEKPRDMGQAIRTVRSGITGKGGSFSGDETAGVFSVSKITGEYAVDRDATVLIIEKPALIPNSLIENEVKKFFGVR
jgi:hypothetical protein